MAARLSLSLTFPASSPATGAALARACAALERSLGLPLIVPEEAETLPPEQAVMAVARRSGVRVRRVSLKPGWHRRDCGPLLAFTAAGEPVALAPRLGRPYRMYAPSSGWRALTSRDAALPGANAYRFYRPLPKRPLSARDLLAFAAEGLRADFALLNGIALAGAALGLLLPVITGALFDRVLPAGDHAQLALLGALLLAGVVLAAAFNALCSLLVLRVEGRLDATLQPALFDRLLRLPAAFFRSTTAGDLSERALGIGSVKLILSDALTNGLLSAAISLFNLILLLAYEPALALLGAVLYAVVLGAVVLAGRARLDYQRRIVAQQGETSGLLLQLFNAMAKLRAAGAESRAFGEWDRRFTRERELVRTGELLQLRLGVFMAAFPLASAMLLYTVASGHPGLTAGQFLAVNVAFTQLLFSGLNLGTAVAQLFDSAPWIERLRPLLEATPEGGGATIELQGAISIRNLSFSYTPGGPKVLDNVSFDIRPGEFVALVSPSGGGKSTLLRLLLGFETPDAGEIRYDGQPLASLDVQALRRQIGVVLQNGQLTEDTLYANIAGSRPLSPDDVWEAVRHAGLEPLVRSLPMGLDTLVNEGGAVLSGGQRQQIQIARALAGNPRLLLLDEPTSALDEATQAAVMAHIRRLPVTRLVIAHRLSTIRDVDRVLMLDNGRVVEVDPHAMPDVPFTGTSVWMPPALAVGRKNGARSASCTIRSFVLSFHT